MIGPSLRKMSLRIGAVPYVPSLSLCRAGVSIFNDSLPPRGASRRVPGRTSFQGPRSPRWSSAPVLPPGPQRAAVWGGRGATARPREAKWSSGVAAVFLVCYNRHMFKDSFGHHDHHHHRHHYTEEHYIIIRIRTNRKI